MLSVLYSSLEFVLSIPPTLPAARNQFHTELLIESAGLFWLAAELLILAYVSAAHRHLTQKPLRHQFRLAIREKTWLKRAAALLAVLAIAVFARHFFISPLPHALRDAPASSDPQLLIRSIYELRAHTHLALWSVFITLWVALEIAIVWQGFQAYRALKKILPHA